MPPAFSMMKGDGSRQVATRGQELASSTEARAYTFGFVGTVLFSATLPATRLATASLDPLFVGFGRPMAGSILAAIFLIGTRQRLPRREEFRSIIAVALTLVLAFPPLIAWAMYRVDASHGGVMLGILPLGSAIAGAFLLHERPPFAFWVTAVLGSALVVGFSLLKGGGSIRAADAVLFACVVVSAIGYAEGARVSRTLGGLQAIAWALVLASPFLVLPTLVFAPKTVHLPANAWFGFAYVCIISQFFGFFPWYRGLSLGGIAKIGQIQLLQPFLTIAISVLWLGEALEARTVLFAVLVSGVVAAGRWASTFRR